MSFLDVSSGGGGAGAWGMNGGGNASSFGGPQDNSVEARELKKLQEDVQLFSRRVSQIENTVKQIGTPRDNHALRNRLRNSVDEAQLQMREIAASVKRINGIDMSGASKKKYHAQRQKLIEDFLNTGKDFKRVSELAAVKEKTPIPETVMKKAQAGAEMDAQEKQALLEAERKEQAAQLENQRAYIDGVNLQRDEEIRQLESNVILVNEMFHDLAQIVKEQDVLIDNIDSNVTHALDDVQEGERQIDKAAEYQKKSRSKLCCILVTVTIILLVVVVIIVVPVVVTQSNK